MWETFLMQLDAEDDDVPFYRPPPSAPARGDNGEPRLSEETTVESAATTTVEQEE